MVENGDGMVVSCWVGWWWFVVVVCVCACLFVVVWGAGGGQKFVLSSKLHMQTALSRNSPVVVVRAESCKEFSYCSNCLHLTLQ